MDNELRTVPLVIYHGNCLDGFTAAWAIWTKHKDWEFYAAKHGNPPPDNIDGRIIYMVDFSYKRPVILDMAARANRIHIIDHHKTAQADLVDLPDNVYVKFDMEHSGARLTWDYFYPSGYEVLPAIINFVEDRDLWQFKYIETKPINEFLFGQEYIFENWSKLADKLAHAASKYEIMQMGQALLDKHTKMTEELCKNKFRSPIGGHEVWVVNLPYNYSSDAGNLLCKGEPFASTFYYDGEGFVYSMRSDENGLDVSDIAKKFGGGGHKNAAGFKIKADLYNPVLKEGDKISNGA
jgi:oligoribonuclease NrnB/cAMP/cGMP phosphodiesterase (DHH superfamily)